MGTLNRVLAEYKKTYADYETIHDYKVVKDLEEDYNNLVDLRNRIKNSTDEEMPNTYEEDHITLDHILDLLEIMLRKSKRYKVVCDNQGGDFGKGRNYTLDQWRKQAMKWCYADENFGIMKEIYEIEDEDLLDDIAEIWDIEFAEMEVGDEMEKGDYTDLEDITVDKMFEECFDKEAYEENKAKWES